MIGHCRLAIPRRQSSLVPTSPIQLLQKTRDRGCSASGTPSRSSGHSTTSPRRRAEPRSLGASSKSSRSAQPSRLPLFSQALLTSALPRAAQIILEKGYKEDMFVSNVKIGARGGASSPAGLAEPALLTLRRPSPLAARSPRRHHLRPRAHRPVPPVEVPCELQLHARVRHRVLRFQRNLAGARASPRRHASSPPALRPRAPFRHGLHLTNAAASRGSRAAVWDVQGAGRHLVHASQGGACRRLALNAAQTSAPRAPAHLRFRPIAPSCSESESARARAAACRRGRPGLWRCRAACRASATPTPW